MILSGWRQAFPDFPDQKFAVMAKTKIASLELELSQDVVKSTILYLDPIDGARRMSRLVPKAFG